VDSKQDQQSKDSVKKTGSNNLLNRSRQSNPATQYHPTPLSGNELSNRESSAASNYRTKVSQAYNSTNNPSNGKSISPNELGKKEQEANKPPAQNTTTTTKQTATNYLKTKAKSKLKKKAIFAVAGAGGGAGAIIIMIIIILISSLVIPDFAEHMIEWQFARLALVEKNQDAEITDEKLASDADPAGADALESEIQTNDAADGVTGTDPLVSSMQEYDPEKVLTTTDRANQIDTPVNINVNGSNVSVEDDGVVAPVKESGSFAGQEHADAIDSGSPTAAATQSKIDTDLIGIENPVTDSIPDPIDENIISEAGGSRAGLDTDEYTNETESQADATITGESETAIMHPTPTAEETGDLDGDDSAAQTIDSDLAKCVQTPSCETELAQDPAEGKIPLSSDADTALENVGSDESTLESGVGKLLEPIATLMFSVCIVYDASEIHSAGTIDSQDDEAEDTALLVNSAADQQKTGQTNGTAVGALSWKLGQLDQTDAEEHSNGQVVNTDGQFSPQLPTDGDSDDADNILGSLFGSGGLSGFAQKTLNAACPSITSTPVLVGLGAIGLAGLATGGEEDAGAEGVEVVAEEAAEQAAEKAANESSSGILKSITKQLTIISATGALSMLARGYTALTAGLGADGLEQGSDFANVATAGNNVLANNLMRSQYYGRPLLNSESNALTVSSTGQLAKINSSKDFYQRYFALSNANSLASNVALDIGSDINISSIGSFFSHIGSIFQPMSWLTSAFGFTKVSAAGAADNPNVDTQDFGNIQFGWSQAELNLIQSDPSYQPMENHNILASINSASNGYPVNYEADRVYACFQSTATLGQLLTDYTFPTGTINWPGTVPSTVTGTQSPGSPPYIQRVLVAGTGGNGSSREYNVSATNGVCAPDNLNQNATMSVPSPTGSQDCFVASGYGQVCNVIFRWRLDQAYQNMLNQQIDIQNASPTPTI
jgi:hypothetical protein